MADSLDDRSNWCAVFPLFEYTDTLYICLLFFAFVLKREIIPSINHMKRGSFDGEWITGKVNLKTIQYTGGRYSYGYTIEGHYTYHERIYMFQDHFYITDTLADYAFKDIFVNENAPADIMILIDLETRQKIW